MAPRPDIEHYELVDSFPNLEADIADIARIWFEGWQTEIIWNTLCSDVTAEDQHRWITDVLVRPRFKLPGNETFAIRERSTGKIRAWTTLSFPLDLLAGEDPTNPKDGTPSPNLANGMKADFAQVFFNDMFGASKKHGYDELKDFHRKGTFTQKEFQRKGLATWLTKHCNTIADTHGRTTGVGARPTSRKMFETQGFGLVATDSFDLRLYGGDRFDDFNTFKRESM